MVIHIEENGIWWYSRNTSGTKDIMMELYLANLPIQYIYGIR